MANNAVDHLSTATATGSYTSTINFDLSSITVTDYRFFKVVGTVRSNWNNTPSRGNGHDFIIQKFNDDATTSNYAFGGLFVDGNATGKSFTYYNTADGKGQYIGRCPSVGKTNNNQTAAWGLFESYIQANNTDWDTVGYVHCTATGGNQSDGFNSGSYDNNISRGSFWWHNTAVLTKITYDLVNSYFTAGTKISLYGFKNTA
jgi:hypothetical protein